VPVHGSEVPRGGNKSFTAKGSEKVNKAINIEHEARSIRASNERKNDENFTLFEWRKGTKKFPLSSRNWNPFIIVKVIFQARELFFSVLAAVNLRGQKA
jgi:hypothetical protein